MKALITFALLLSTACATVDPSLPLGARVVGGSTAVGLGAGSVAAAAGLGTTALALSTVKQADTGTAVVTCAGAALVFGVVGFYELFRGIVQLDDAFMTPSPPTP